jgi:hypothetical protein
MTSWMYRKLIKDDALYVKLNLPDNVCCRSSMPIFHRNMRTEFGAKYTQRKSDKDNPLRAHFKPSSAKYTKGTDAARPSCDA